MRKPIIIVWRVKKGKVESLDRKFWTSAITNMNVPLFAGAAIPASGGNFSFGAVAGATFGPGGAGFVLMQLLLLAVVGWSINQIASAMGHAQLGNQAKLTTTLVAFALIIGTVINALKQIGQFLS